MVVEQGLAASDEAAHLITDEMLEYMRSHAPTVAEVVVRPGEVLTDTERREIEEEIDHPIRAWVAVPFLGAPNGVPLPALRRGTSASAPRLMRTTRAGRATTARRGAAHRATRSSTGSEDSGGSEPEPPGSTQPRGLRSQGRRANSLRVEVAP